MSTIKEVGILYTYGFEGLNYLALEIGIDKRKKKKKEKEES